MAAKVYKIIKVQISKSKKMKSLIPLSLMIHSEIIESNRWRTQKNPDENSKYSIWSILQWNYCFKNWHVKDYATFEVKSKCHFFKFYTKK